MQFERFRSNIAVYLDEFYKRYHKQIADRPASSYQAIFDNEAASINRYIEGVVDEIRFEVKESFEKLAGYQKADEMSEQFDTLLPDIKIQGCVYKAAVTSRTPGSASAASKSYVSGYSQIHVSGSGSVRSRQRLMYVTAGGAVLGSLAGYAVSKAFLATMGGLALGGLAGFVVAGVLLNSKPKTAKKYITLSSSTGPVRPASPQEGAGRLTQNTAEVSGESVKRQLDKRHQEVLQYILSLIDQMEHNYRILKRTAG